MERARVLSALKELLGATRNIKNGGADYAGMGRYQTVELGAAIKEAEKAIQQAEEPGGSYVEALRLLSMCYRGHRLSSDDHKIISSLLVEQEAIQLDPTPDAGEKE